jgi:hypothetical protein
MMYGNKLAGLSCENGVVAANGSATLLAMVFFLAMHHITLHNSLDTFRGTRYHINILLNVIPTISHLRGLPLRL